MSMKLDLEVSKFEKELLKFVKSQILLYFDDTIPTSAFIESVCDALSKQIEYAYRENLHDEYCTLEDILGFIEIEMDGTEDFLDDIEYPDRDDAVKMIATPFKEDFNHFKEITDKYCYSFVPENCVKAEFEANIFDDIREFIEKYNK